MPRLRPDLLPARSRLLPAWVGTVGLVSLLLIVAATTVASGPPTLNGPAAGSTVRTRTVTFTFSATGPDPAFECRFDRNAAEPCRSPFRTGRLKEGWHRFELILIGDEPGREVRVARRFRVDTRPPETRIHNSPPRLVRTIRKKVRVRVGFHGRKGARRFQCRIDGRSWRRCRSPLKVARGPGRHRIAVRAIDRAGNIDRSPAIRRWRVWRWQPNVVAARRYAAGRGGPVAFSVDLGWRSYGYRKGLRLPSASTIKAVLMVTLLRRRSVRNRPLSAGEKSLIGAMIRYSDNGAASTVRNLVGGAAVRRVARRGRMRNFGYSTIWGQCRVSTDDYARFMRALPRLVPRRYRRFALGQLASITPSQRWGIGSIGLGRWKRHFKGGWGIGDGGYGGVVSHQIALLRLKGVRGGRVGLAIETGGNPSVEYGNTTIRMVAKRLLRGLPRRLGPVR